jgi:hypothetical protein
MGKSQYVYTKANITVHENKAPTTESVRLLNDMQEKAKENLVKSIKLNDNVLNFVEVVFSDSFIHQDFIHYFRFKLNGKENIIKIESNRNFIQNIAVGAMMHEEQIIRKHFLKELSQKIADEIVSQIPEFFEK